MAICPPSFCSSGTSKSFTMLFNATLKTLDINDGSRPSSTLIPSSPSWVRISLMKSTLIFSGVTIPFSIGRAHWPSLITIETSNVPAPPLPAASTTSAGGGTNCFFECFSNWLNNLFISTGLVITSFTPALAAEIKYSSESTLDRITILHLNANSGSDINLWDASIASPDFHSPSIRTISGIVASAVPSACLNVPALVTS